MTDPLSRNQPRPPGEPAPYELEPAPPPADGDKPAVAHGSDRSYKPEPGKLSPQSVLAGFDEDADFDKDPDVERALGKVTHAKADPAPRPAGEPFVTPWLGSSQVWGVVGGFVLVGAVVAAAMTSQNKLATSLLVLYTGLVHTGTGLVAVYLTAKLASRPMGAIDLAAARMLVAVSAFLLLFSLNIRLAGTTKWEELILAAAAYVGTIAGLFRLWGRNLGILVIMHFLLWLVFELGVRLSGWATAGAAAAGKPS